MDISNMKEELHAAHVRYGEGGFESQEEWKPTVMAAHVDFAENYEELIVSKMLEHTADYC